MVPILLDRSLFMYGGEGKKKGRGQSYFRLARGGAKLFYKEVKGGHQFDRKLYFPNFQIFILLFVPVIYLTTVTELFTITFFS